MARLEVISGGYLVHPQSAVERALLDHGREDGGELVLDQACYPVRGAALLLPVEISYDKAVRICRAFEAAARAHQQAAARRGDFRLLD